MSNITITHSDSGLLHAQVLKKEQISPNFVRVTLGGADLTRFQFVGADQWFRLVIPVHEGDRLDLMPQRFGVAGFLRYLSLPKGVRPVVRNYTVRSYRPSPAEIDIDFVVHGSEGIAAPWASRVESDFEVALIDQGCGWHPKAADWYLLTGDESSLPALAGIIRDLPDESAGHAFIELFDKRDRQELNAPKGFQVHWLERSATQAPGSKLLPTLERFAFPSGTPYAFSVGESALATGVRRHLVAQRGVPKAQITFSGYWKLGKSAWT